MDEYCIKQVDEWYYTNKAVGTFKDHLNNKLKKS